MPSDSCCVIGCSEFGRRKNKENDIEEENISFHRFPISNNEMLEKWIFAIQRYDWLPTKGTRVCSKHFTLDSFKTSGWSSRRSLKKHAIPTIFNFPKTSTKPSMEIKKSLNQAFQNCKRKTQNNKEILDLQSERFPGYKSNNKIDMPFVPTFCESVKYETSNVKYKEFCDDEMDDIIVETPFVKKETQGAESESEYLEEDYTYAEGNLCRFCTKPVGEDGKDIFSDDRQSVNIQEIISFILPGQVHQEDKLPHHICIVCINKWKECYQTILEFFAAEAYFRSQEMHEVSLVDDQLLSSNPVAESPVTISDAGLPSDFSKQNNVLLIEDRQNNFQLKSNVLEEELETKEVNKSDSNPEYFEQCDFCSSKFSSLKELALHIEMEHPSTNINQTFCCNKCSMVFENSRSLIIHMQSSHPDEKIYFPCEDCPKIFNYKHLLIQHRKLKHRKHICKICGESFYFVKTLDRHMSVHNSSIKCSTCNKVFKNAYWRRIHEKSHMMDNNHLCWICGKFFQIKSSLDFHLLSHEGLKVNPYKCHICGKEYVSISGINKHKLIHKERVRSFKCTKCNKDFFTNDSLKQHFSCHSNVKPYVCHCGVAFKRRSNLYKHKKRHLLEENSNKLKTSIEMNKDTEVFTCSFCDKEIISKLSFKYHLGKHTGNKKPFDCETCGALFGNLTNYKNHIKIHSTELPFVCETCGLGFRTGRMLKQHKLVHEEERPYACSSCPVSFKRLYSLKEHKIVHSGLRPYECVLCKRIFARRSDCRKHIKRTHGIPVQEVDTHLHNIINDGPNDKTNKECNSSDIKEEQATKIDANMKYNMICIGPVQGGFLAHARSGFGAPLL